MNCIRTIRPALVLGCLVLLASTTAAADAPSAPKKVVTIEGITEYQLDNGLRILLFRDDSTPTVTVNLTVFVGSRQEGYGETGMAHLLEHMVFKGTPTHKDVPLALRQHGATFNGSTWLDRTNYYETMPGTDANLEFAIRLEADRMVNSFIKREDLLSEMTVVRNEFEMGENNPQNILSQRMTAVAYEWHNYGKSTIGNRSDIERVPIENLQAFYRKNYQPDNAMLVVAGKFDEKKALAYIGKYFGALKKPSRKLDDTYTEEPAQDGERTVVLRRVGKVGVVGAVYHICAGPHEDYPAVQVLNDILVAEPSGRLYQALVESKQASSVSGSVFPTHDPGVIEFLAQTDPGKLDSVRETMIGLLEKLPAGQFTDEEVERAKRRLLKNRENMMTKPGSVAIELSEWAAQGDWRLFFLHRDRVAKVTASEVARVAGRYLQRSNRTVGLYIPSEQVQRVAIPQTPSVADLVKNYKGSQAVAAGEAFDPTPENIEKRVQRSELPSGVKVALLPKKTRGETVVARLTVHYGNEKSLRGQASAAQFLGTLMLRGTKSHNRLQLKDELDKLGARLNAGGFGQGGRIGGVFGASSLGELTFTIEAKRATLPAVLQLLGEVLREPTFPANEFDVLKRETLQFLQSQSTEPMMLAPRMLMRKLSPYPKDDVRYVPTMEESIARLQAVTVEQVRRIYTEQVGGQAGEFSAVGDFDPEETKALLQSILKDWKSEVAYERIARPAKTGVAGSQEDLRTPDKAMAIYTAGLMLAMTDTDPDYAALQLADFIMGSGIGGARLGNRLRQKEGWSYGAGSMLTADAQDKSARFLMFAICNPDNMQKLDKAAAEELDKFIKDGPSAGELIQSQKAYLQGSGRQRASDTTLATQLGECLYQGRTFAYYADLEKKIAELTPDQVTEAFRKYISPKKLVIIRAGDFKKK